MVQTALPPILIRAARLADCADLVPLIDAAGEGLPSYLWAQAAGKRQRPSQVGLASVRSDTARISWRRAVVADVDGLVAGCLYHNRLPDVPHLHDPDLPDLFVPLQELEDRACGTRHIHMLATRPALRRHGIGRALLEHAESQPGPRGVSLIVSDANPSAWRLYLRAGYRVEDQRPMVMGAWPGRGRLWLLMRK